MNTKETAQATTELHPQIKMVLDELGTGDSNIEKTCYTSFLQGEYDRVKAFRLISLSDSYYRCLSYLASAVMVSQSDNQSNFPTIISEAATACADYKREDCLRRLSAVLHPPFNYSEN